MPFTVNFFTFSKRENSTKRPPDTGLSLDCTLKDDCGILSPIIRVNKMSLSSPPLYNYAYIPVFARYYFVTEWTWSEGLWNASLQVDALASWKSYIGSSEQYILRSSYEKDENILDTFYPTKGGKVQVPSVYLVDYFTSFFSSGRYVVGIINSDPDAVGAVSYYVFTQAQFGAFRDYLMSDTGWLSVAAEALDDALLRAIYNPFQYIASCIWLPFTPSLGSSLSSVKFGWWTIPIDCYRLGVLDWEYNFSISIPKHPSAETKGKYLNLSPFSEYVLYIPPWGMVPIDSTRIYDSTNIHIYMRVDGVSGTGVIHVSKGENYVGDTMSVHTAQVGVPIQLAQIGRDYLATASSTAASAGRFIDSMTHLNFGAAAEAAISGIESTVKAATPQLLTNGTNGSKALCGSKTILYATFFDTVDDDNADHGKPLCAVRAIESIPGYVLALSPDISIPATAEENRAVKEYMSGGFFYE